MRFQGTILLCLLLVSCLQAAPIILDEDSVSPTPGNAPWRVLEETLPSILRRHPDSVILFAGRALLKDHTIDEYIVAIRVATEKCRTANIRPILVALPDFGDIPPEKAKAAAIRLKQLALELHLAVIDLYSAQLRENLPPDFFFLHNGIRWNQFVPPARQWLASKMTPQDAE